MRYVYDENGVGSWQPSEVITTPGQCVSWHCDNPAPDGPECAAHAAEPMPKWDAETLAHNAAVDRRHYHANIATERPKRTERQRKWRQTPAGRALAEREAARKREKRATARAAKQLATTGGSS